MIAGDELRRPLRGCAYDILGFGLGAGLVIAAVATDPTRLLAPPTPGDAPGMAAVCVAPFVVVLLLWLMARRWLIMRLPAAFVLGVYAAALGVGAVAMALS